MSKTSNQRNYAYRVKAFDSLTVRLTLGHRDRVKAAAAEAGQSMSEYVAAALTAYGCPVSHTAARREGDNLEE